MRVRVTRDVLISLCQAKISLQIWNSKDRLSGLARMERLKPFRLPQVPCEAAAHVCGELQLFTMTTNAPCLLLSHGRVLLRWHQDFG